MNKFKNTREFVIALHGNDSTSMVMPYDRHKPDNTEWWILPKGAENPAYKYGKIFVEETTSLGKYFCGFCLEKGYEKKEICESNPTEEMRSDWDWNKFKKQIEEKSGKLKSIFKSISSHKLDCVVSISYGMQGGGKSKFLNLIMNEDLNISGFDGVVTIFDIMDIIKKEVGINNMNWAWVSLKIGIFLDKDEDINELEVWKNYLEPWQRFINPMVESKS